MTRYITNYKLPDGRIVSYETENFDTTDEDNPLSASWKLLERDYGDLISGKSAFEMC